MAGRPANLQMSGRARQGGRDARSGGRDARLTGVDGGECKMKQRILVVDDELGPRESFRMLLKDRFDVCTASNGEQALEAVREGEFLLVFLDLRMPGLDGIQVLKELRETHPELPVVVVTAYSSLETANQALALGAMSCLVKPFSARDVDRWVEKALAARAGEK